MTTDPTASRLAVIRARMDLGNIRCALFDFDGTLSLIRQGWREVMIPMMVEIISQAPHAEDPDTLERIVSDAVTKTTGKQTIHQMILLRDTVEKRGGHAADPLDYKREYLSRLDERIAERVKGLETGRINPETMRMPSGKAFLNALKSRDVTLYCASGTDEPYAQHEAELLGVADFFEGGIRGAQDDYASFSKRQVIRDIITAHGLGGPELLIVGDGFVEIEEGAAVNAITVGVASDEEALLNGDAGVVWDEEKRERLIAAGADVMVPDFRDADSLIDYLFKQ